MNTRDRDVLPLSGWEKVLELSLELEPGRGSVGRRCPMHHPHSRVTFHCASESRWLLVMGRPHTAGGGWPGCAKPVSARDTLRKLGHRRADLGSSGLPSHCILKGHGEWDQVFRDIIRPQG